MAKTRKPVIPKDVAAIREMLAKIFNTPYSQNRKAGNAKFGVYAFFDYDREPIYVGQTWEKLRSRIGRHLTNQRTDAVAMHVLDPFEVAEIEIWPFFDLQDRINSKPPKSKERKRETKKAKRHLEKAEYTVYQRLIANSKFEAVLNEKAIKKTEEVALPPSIRGSIIPPELFEERNHPDLRIARRTSTIAKLAQVIAERQVSKGLRQTLLTQAKRLLDLAMRRFDEVGGEIPIQDENEQAD